MNDSKMLPITRRLLEGQIQDTGKRAQKEKRGGMDEMGGDGYHDEQFVTAENAFHLYTIMGAKYNSLMGTGQLLDKPEQNDVIEMGHVVTINFLNDPFIERDVSVVVHLLSAADKQALDQYSKSNGSFKQQYNNGHDTMIVSIDSALGSALLGKQRGEKGSYKGLDELNEATNLKFAVVDKPESIDVTTLFDLEM
jgi:transcription elongation GreA/GreB family factor